jgi:hypothetical protein
MKGVPTTYCPRKGSWHLARAKFACLLLVGVLTFGPTMNALLEICYRNVSDYGYGCLPNPNRCTACTHPPASLNCGELWLVSMVAHHENSSQGYNGTTSSTQLCATGAPCSAQYIYCSGSWGTYCALDSTLDPVPHNVTITVADTNSGNCSW